MKRPFLSRRPWVGQNLTVNGRKMEKHILDEGVGQKVGDKMHPDIPRKRLGIIGIGKMGEALISGLIRSGRIAAKDLCACDILSERRERIEKAYGVECHSEASKVVEKSEVIIVAVRPRDVKPVLETIRERLTERHLVISIAAGVSISFIRGIVGKDLRIIRAMPNNPCMVGEGMIALTASSQASQEDLELAKEIFSSVGRVAIVEERLFDAVTGLSGSGPAYVYLVIEAMADAGVRMGLSKDLAIQMAAQTTLGSAKMVLETKEHPAKLRDQVATPQGTTVEGLYELEKARIRAAFMNAIERATKRAKELAIE
jgi:pyrroline-5-carboxylate reductase